MQEYIQSKIDKKKKRLFSPGRKNSILKKSVWEYPWVSLPLYYMATSSTIPVDLQFTSLK